MAFILLMLQGCSSVELAIDLYKKQKRDTTEEAVVAAPRYKVGNPYKVAGVWYYPERDLTYDDTGIGSWYGNEFAGKLTANGEIFNGSLCLSPPVSINRYFNLSHTVFFHAIAFFTHVLLQISIYDNTHRMAVTKVRLVYDSLL